MICSCCGEEKDASRVAALQCHPETVLCRECIGWLLPRAGGIDVTPTLPVTDMDAAEAFYEAAGFDVHRYDDGFAFVQFDEQSTFDLDRVEGFDPATNGAGCFLIVDDVAGWHARLSASGLAVSPMEDQPWGMTEFTLRDPDRNNLRIGTSTPDR